MTIEMLTPEETRLALTKGTSRGNILLNEIAMKLEAMVGTGESVFVSGLEDANVNALRTKMARRGILITIRKVRRGQSFGHVIVARGHTA